LVSYKVLFLIAIIFFGIKISAQILPSYPERLFGGKSDSSQFMLKSLQASEGFINPEEYKLGPGDNIFISISGIEERNFNLLINHEGFLYIPRVGVIDLRNKNLAEGKKIIESKLRENFRNVDIYVGLGEIRSIKVSLIGDVIKQSTYILTSNSRLLDLIKNSQGLTRSSDYRNIKIVSKNGENKKVDYLSFLRLGDYSQNPYLRDGDIIVVDKTDKTIFISGQVKYPGRYEFKEGEAVDEIIILAGGLLYKARTDSIEVVRFTENGASQVSDYYSFDYLESHSVRLKFSDQILIREKSEYFEEQWVNLKGKVKYPGLYKIEKNKTTLSEIINQAGGFLEDAALVDASVFRIDADSSYDPEFERIKLIPRVDMTDDEYDYLKAKSRQRYGKVVVDFSALFRQNQRSEDILLKRGDLITIPEKKNYITLIGQVVNPGNIIYDPKLRVEDYIELAGGFSWRAIEGDVRVIKVNTGEWVDAVDIERLDPGDTIWILEDPPGPKFWDVFTTSLSILGQVATVIAATVAVILATR
jgi:protein involved in polysaccharide export with SLBB domain